MPDRSDDIAPGPQPLAGGDPHVHQREAKRLDGQPHTEWTYHLHGARASVFDGGVPIFYEPLNGYDDVLSCLRLNEALASAGSEDQLSVMLGVRWYESGFYAADGVLPTLGNHERFVGRHSITAIAGDGQQLKFGNSWGAKWGHRNTGALRRRDFDDYVDEAWLLRRCDIGLSPAMYARLSTGHTARDFAAAWSTENVPDRDPVDVRGALCELVHYRVISAATQRVSHVYELRRGLRAVGRAHVALVGDLEVTACLQELFVPPRSRGRGFGERLEQEASQLARQLELSRIRCPTYEADATDLATRAATGLAQKSGYSLSSYFSRRPTVVRLASKLLR